MTPFVPLNVATLTLAGVLLANLAALVWGAATISKTVKTLERSNERIVDKLGNHETRISVLEDRDER
jgi:uncharacterized membrane protein